MEDLHDPTRRHNVAVVVVAAVVKLHLTSSCGLMSRTALSCSLVPWNTITQFGRQSWFSSEKLGEGERHGVGRMQ